MVRFQLCKSGRYPASILANFQDYCSTDVSIFDVQKKIRKCDFEILLQDKVILELEEIISQQKKLSIKNEHYLNCIEREKDTIEKEKRNAESRLTNYQQMEKDIEKDSKFLY